MKQFDLQGNEYDIQIKEMLDNIPKSNNVASAYTGISVDELQTIIDKFKTIPNYNDLINDNNKKDKEIERLNNIINELEEYLDVQSKIYLELDKIKDSRIGCQLLRVKDKLKELKDSDKE